MPALEADSSAGLYFYKLSIKPIDMLGLPPQTLPGLLARTSAGNKFPAPIFFTVEVLNKD